MPYPAKNWEHSVLELTWSLVSQFRNQTLTLQTISLKYPRTPILLLYPFPPSFSEEANFQALSVLKSLEVFCSWAGLKLHIAQSPGKISVCPAKSGWWQLSNSRELHLGAGMEEQFHLTNWNPEILQPTYLLLAVNAPFHSRRHIKSVLCFPNLPQKYCIWQNHVFCKDWGFGTPLLRSSRARAFEATDFMTISVAHREHLLGALYSPPSLFLCSTLNF